MRSTILSAAVMAALLTLTACATHADDLSARLSHNRSYNGALSRRGAEYRGHSARARTYGHRYPSYRYRSAARLRSPITHHYDKRSTYLDRSRAVQRYDRHGSHHANRHDLCRR